MHETVAPLQVGLNVVGTLGVTGAMLAAGNLLGRTWGDEPVHDAAPSRPSPSRTSTRPLSFAREGLTRLTL